MSVDEARRQSRTRARLGDRLARFLAAPPDPGRAERGAAPEGRGANLLRLALQYVARAATGGLVLVNLEDLFLETEPQNLPGTGAEQPNWSRRVRAADSEVGTAVEKAGEWLSG